MDSCCGPRFFLAFPVALAALLLGGCSYDGHLVFAPADGDRPALYAFAGENGHRPALYAFSVENREDVLRVAEVGMRYVELATVLSELERGDSVSIEAERLREAVRLLRQQLHHVELQDHLWSPEDVARAEETLATVDFNPVTLIRSHEEQTAIHCVPYNGFRGETTEWSTYTFGEPLRIGYHVFRVSFPQSDHNPYSEKIHVLRSPTEKVLRRP